jgi:Zn-dependent protease
MHEHASWSLNLGRWGGVHVRLHMAFLLFVAFTLYLSFQHTGGSGEQNTDWIAVQSLAVLLAGVLVHEWGHLWATKRLGGSVDQIVLGPLGGLAPPNGLRDPAAELLAHLGGPLANFVACLFCLPVLLATSSAVAGLLCPWSPRGVTEGGTLMVLVKLLFWINWGLLLVNLLPAFPFDGGGISRALILLRWPGVGRRGASVIVGHIAKVIALSMVVLPFLFPPDNEVTLLPTQFAFVLLGIFLFFSAQNEERREAVREAEEQMLRDFDVSVDLDQLEREFAHAAERPTGPLRRWLQRRQERRLSRQRQLEEEEERRVDEILAKLYQDGMQALSAEDRALLERVSARYRSRQQG